MSTPSFAFVGPVLLVLGDEVAHLRGGLTAGLAAAGIVQPEADWMARFERHVELAVRQGATEGDADLAVGEVVLWLGQRLHLGHGMVLDPSFVQARRELFHDLVDRGLVVVVGLVDSQGPRGDDVPTIQIDPAALRDDPGHYVRTEVLDRVGHAEVDQ